MVSGVVSGVVCGVCTIPPGLSDWVSVELSREMRPSRRLISSAPWPVLEMPEESGAYSSTCTGTETVVERPRTS